MIAATLKRFTAWSLSRLKQWEECPRHARLVHLDRLPEPKGPALENGIRVHALASEYLSGRLKPLPNELARFQEPFATLRKKKATPDIRLALDSLWRPVDWFDQTVRLRMILDALTITGRGRRGRHVIDFKTGRVRDQVDKDQLELYGMGVMAANPTVNIVTSELWYLDAGLKRPDPPFETARAVAEGLRSVWEERAAPLLTDGKFAPRPGNHCRWCHFRTSNGGPCEYG